MFEFDPAKSAANKAKHGIDFEEAKALWDDQQRIEAGVRVHGQEERRIIVGRIGGLHWTAIVTERGDKIRIISVRRSRESERQHYDG